LTVAQATWEKIASTAGQLTAQGSGGRLKFIIGGVLILAAVAYLMLSGTLAGAQYYMTVDQLLSDTANTGRTVRMSGVVLGDSIQYDPDTLTIEFTIANVPSEFDDLGTALHEAANNPDASRISVRVEDQVMPDLLQHEAQAILTGQLGEDGVFHASELLLKCPSRFIEGGPEQADVQAAS
jgi:cytochrome c-type biogenesis protein CcmE